MSMNVSKTQTKVLQNLIEGKSANAHVMSMSESGGLVGTMASLRRNGWIDEQDFITPAGRAAIGR